MLQCYFPIKLTKLKKQRAFGQPNKIFWETDLYLQLMCLETHRLERRHCFKRGQVTMSLVDVHILSSSFTLRCSFEKAS